VTAPPTRWLTVSRTITRIWAETGLLLTPQDVMGVTGQRYGLVVVSTHDHVRVTEESVDAYVARCRGAGIPVGEGPKLPEDIEDEFQRGKEDL
jgi:hypothetical protein